ncbi:hypothetical protein HPB50_010670 [Hyalomma asiaticum]|uniref:Uncharacterized protein n=1 Tax=Hyalomma asiaticum TaxID=266040 RepID=A0ACB7TFX2_HYAAI|nr:hypothetical protein HPB50_010670 [Hyalomma asiaticum]
MNGWAETQGPLTELQNGFRRNRRGEDNLFVLIQSIEVARRESRGLVACFLDVAKAYDSVPHGHLLSRMEGLSMPPVWIELLRRLYTDNTVEANFGGTRTRPPWRCQCRITTFHFLPLHRNKGCAEKERKGETGPLSTELTGE